MALTRIETGPFSHWRAVMLYVTGMSEKTFGMEADGVEL